MSKYSCCSHVPFEYVVRFMAKCSEVPSKKKEAVLVDFFKRCVPRPSPDIIQIFRLLLPAVSRFASACWCEACRPICQKDEHRLNLLKASVVAGI